MPLQNALFSEELPDRIFNRKQQQRIAKRKVKVQQMITEQGASLAAINIDEYDNQKDYQRLWECV